MKIRTISQLLNLFLYLFFYFVLFIFIIIIMFAEYMLYTRHEVTCMPESDVFDGFVRVFTSIMS